MSPLRIEDLEVRLSGRPILRQVSLEAMAGEVVGLIGPNGAGKTTLLRAAAGLLPPTAGRIHLFGRALADWSQVERARTLAYLPQARDAVWRITVADLVRLGRLPHRAGWWQGPTAEDRTAVAEALDACDVAGLAERPMTELSGGELARAVLARVVATRPSLLLADEPTAGLDPAHGLDVMQLFRRLASDGLAVVVTLHDLNLAGRFCDRLVLLDGGARVAEGVPASVLTPERLRSAYQVEAAQVTVAGESLVVPLRRAGGSSRAALR
ncbi:ABC transporter ATP-binding protein [Algihabitans albus]|uniref:ABC transporter ATP-binding protein n=1 Tax=Algihabitans albus TaxID=2164067 RepID=UPI000E5D4BBA|nr:ABC transporter ATP-binding protein [Algihabitans albus]